MLEFLIKSIIEKSRKMYERLHLKFGVWRMLAQLTSCSSRWSGAARREHLELLGIVNRMEVVTVGKDKSKKQSV